MSTNGESKPVTFAKAVRSPLGFFALIAGVVEVALTVTAGATQAVPLWIPMALIGLLIVIVAVIALVRPTAFYHPNDLANVIVNLDFTEKNVPPSLANQGSKLHVFRNGGAKPRSKATSPTWGHGGWYVRLTPHTVEPSDTVQLELADDEGNQWRTRPFNPYATVQTVSQGGSK